MKANICEKTMTDEIHDDAMKYFLSDFLASYKNIGFIDIQWLHWNLLVLPWKLWVHSFHDLITILSFIDLSWLPWHLLASLTCFPAIVFFFCFNEMPQWNVLASLKFLGFLLPGFSEIIGFIEMLHWNLLASLIFLGFMEIP